MDEGIKPRKRNDTDIFYECLPFYLSIGMSSKEYWEGDALLPKAYRKAYKTRQEQTNHEAWLHGLYVYDAVMSALTHLSPKTDTHKTYTPQPYSFNQEKVSEEKKVEAEVQAEMWMKTWVSATQKMFEKK